jgi:hypothetical protein
MKIGKHKRMIGKFDYIHINIYEQEQTSRQMEK